MRRIQFFLILSISVFVQGFTEEYQIGDDCESHEDCESIPNATCNSDICECIEGYLPSTNKTSCFPLATKIGDKCEITQQCSLIPSAECLNNTCVLAEALLPKAVTTVMTTAKPKEQCKADKDCSSFVFNGVCKNGTCVVGVPMPISPKTLGNDMFVLGKPCTNDSDCSGEDSSCIDKLCKCKENFVPAQNFKSCLPKAKAVGDKCIENAQCLALNASICENEKCTQKIPKFLSSMGEKIPALLIGSSCQTDSECKHLTHALCLENVCQCDNKYITSVTSNACLEKANKEGDPCEIDKQCEDIKGATCVQKKCVKPGVVGNKLGKQNSGSSTQTVSKLILGAILLIKMSFV